ncbi:MAG: hypothetical protein OEX81_05235 [Candidatus Pacebacteria bacterium]|nr:hypothetical protein [Candidatus Paceibacterota bacterium]
MLEVAAVASHLADTVEDKDINKKDIVEWALLHDMGNIVKFKDFISPHMKLGEDYWRKVQKKFTQKYSDDAHQATIKIIKEMNLVNEQPILHLIENNDFRAISHNGYQSIETRICDYADMCVSPHGIVGFDKRIEDLIKRYKLDKSDLSTKTRKENSIELNKKVNFELKTINKIDFSDLIEKLSEYDISLKI